MFLIFVHHPFYLSVVSCRLIADLAIPGGLVRMAVHDELRPEQDPSTVDSGSTLEAWLSGSKIIKMALRGRGIPHEIVSDLIEIECHGIDVTLSRLSSRPINPQPK